MSMIDNDLKTYLDGQFEIIREIIEGTKDNIARHADEILRLENGLSDVTTQITILKEFKANHIIGHQEKSGNVKYSLQMWIIVVCAIATITTSLIIAFTK